MLIIFSLISIVNFILRKLFKIEKVKNKFFSNNYINVLHRRVDKWNRYCIAIITILIWSLFIFNDLSYLIFIGLTVPLALDYGVKAFFELKYSDYPKRAIITLSEMLLMLTAAIIIVLQLERWFP
ncbi:DUF4181 domain-containing protein [Paraliobacillus zengyii]|nr:MULTISPECIES: DUF4181 domain-containing protein [Paraliobacillus]